MLDIAIKALAIVALTAATILLGVLVYRFIRFGDY